VPEIKNSHKIAYYYLLCAFAFLIFLKTVTANAFKEIVEFFVTFLPFIIILLMSFHGFYKYRKDPEHHLEIRKHILKEIFYLLFITLLFYVLYSPRSFMPYYHWLYSATGIMELETLFFILAYVAIITTVFILVFFFIRLYQKSKGAYLGSTPTLFKHCLESIFIILFVILAASVMSFPHTYSPITDFISDAIYTVSLGNIQIPKFDGSANQRITSLKRLTDSLGGTFEQLKNQVADSHKKFTDNVAETKSELDNVISRTNKDLKIKLSNDISDKLDLSGGTLDGKLTVKKSLIVEGTANLKDVIPHDDDTYDLGTISSGWNNVYAARLYGSSLLTVGDGSTSHSLTSSNDFMISGKFEVNGTTYFDGSVVFGDDLNLGGNMLTGLATPVSDSDAVTKLYLDNVASGKISSAIGISTGDIIYFSSSGTPARRGIGSAGQVLTVVGGLPEWAAAPTGFTNPMNAQGDIIVGESGGSAGRLGLGTNGQVLKSNGTTAIWGDVSSGTLTGSGATNQVAYWDGASSLGTWDASTARTNLGLVIGTNVQAYNAGLADIAGLAKTDSNIIVGNGTNWVAESGSTARTSLGLGSLATLNSINNDNWSGTDLAVSNGGTGASSFTAGQILFGAGTSALNTDAKLFWDNTNKYLGIGTNTPSSGLDIYSSTADPILTLTAAHASAYNPMIYFRTGASPATQFSLGVDAGDSNKFKIYSGASVDGTSEFSIDTSGVATITNLKMGTMAFETDAGIISWMDMPVSGSAANNTVESYTAQLDGNSMLTIYGKANGSGVVTGLGVGILNTAPGALLDIGTAGSTLGTLRLEGNTSGYVQVQTAAAAGSWTMTLPANDGDAGQQLQTDGNGITSWQAAGSLRSIKDVTGFADSSQALSQILSTNVYHFHYKPGMGTGDTKTDYVGVMADEALWAMHFNGTIVNPVNTLGYMVLGIQAEDAKITDVQTRLTQQENTNVEQATKLAGLDLQTSQNITSLAGLQKSVDENLALISQNINDNTQTIKDIQDNIKSVNNQISDLTETLQKQIDELKTKTNQDLNVAQIELNKENIAYLNLLLGIQYDENGQVVNPGEITVANKITAPEIDILDKLSAQSAKITSLTAEKVETGGLIIKIADDSDATIGTSKIESGETNVIVKTGKATSDSKIFVTPKITTDKTLSVTNIITDGDQKGFKVEIKEPALEADLPFDWWIVDTK